MAARKPRSEKPSGGSPGNGVLPKLRAFYDFMNQNGLDALELDESGLHVKLVRRRAASVPVPVAAYQAAAPQAPSHAPAAAAPSGGPEPLPPGASAVKAPMMGIFYRAPSPSSPPFVKEGDKVQAGQVLCMIEAMKVFNEIKADYPGTVIKVLLENGKPVKSGQDLLLVQR